MCTAPSWLPALIFYSVLLKLPKDQIHWVKSVVKFHQSQDCVDVECQNILDDTTGKTVMYKAIFSLAPTVTLRYTEDCMIE